MSALSQHVLCNDTCPSASNLNAGTVQKATLEGYHAYHAAPDPCMGEELRGRNAFYSSTIHHGVNYELLVTSADDTDVDEFFWFDCLSASGVDEGCADVKERVSVARIAQSGTVIIQVIAHAGGDTGDGWGT